ncbi:MAG: V-type ATPase 116kDa subunit family protein [bacterium]
MRKLLLVGKKARLPELLEFLQGKGSFQVDQVQEQEFPAFGENTTISKELPRLENQLNRIQALLSILGRVPLVPSDPPPMALNELEREILDHRAQLVDRTEELNFLKTYGVAMDFLLPLLNTLEGSPHLQAIGFVSSVADRKNRLKLQEDLDQATQKRVQFHFHTIEENLTVNAIAFLRQDEAKIRSLLTQHGFSELKLPAAVEGLSTREAILRIQERLQQIPGEIEDVRNGLESLRREQGWHLFQRKNELLDEMERMKATSLVSASHYACFIVGWVPQKNVDQLVRKLKDRFEQDVVIHPLKLDPHEEIHAPIKLENVPLFRPFEMFLSIFRPPRYDRIDPTPILAIFFPLFFGLVLGDIGYGVLLLISFLILFFRNKTATWHSIAIIGLLCSGWSILFGVFFGELFGNFGEQVLHMRPLLLNRMNQEGIIIFLLVTLGLGLLQIFMGFLIQVVLSFREREYKEGFEAIFMVGWITGLLLALFSAIGLLAGPMKPITLYVGLGLLLVGWGGIIAIKGPIMGAIEPLSAMGNILSYARLAGIGISAAYLAFAANTIGGLFPSIVLAFAVGLICHLLFFILGIISPIIQSARLHFVEFFSKFHYHELIGRPFKPLTKLSKKGETE